MRSLSLLGAAAEAEALRLRRSAELFGRSAALTATASVFGLLALGFAHVAGWVWLSRTHDVFDVAIIMASVDAAIMLVFLLMARRPKHDPVMAEAAALRRSALIAARQDMPLQGALTLLSWRRPAYALGGLLAQRLVRRVTGR